jgi:hypothetical protein
MNARIARLFAAFAIVLSAMAITRPAQADPLPGRDLLKFQQKPMIATTVLDNNGAAQTYMGHDELSTAYGFANANNQIVDYRGRFVADDFADKLSTPVVHVKWWGSYNHDIINPNMPVNRFLISFESDVPCTLAPCFSHPGQPLLNQVVTRGPLAPGSGTFTETLIRGPDPILQESLYEYNAELHLNAPFPEQRDNVYWLKIAAMVNVPTTVVFDPFNPPQGVTQWGWHNRDYSVQDLLASPVPVPGEFIEGQIGPAVQPTPVWHFQDDAIAGDVTIQPNTAGGGFQFPNVLQPVAAMTPQNYLDGIDGPAGATPGQLGIGRFSKDLAFELYTIVPEPGACMLLAIGAIGFVSARRRLTKR